MIVVVNRVSCLHCYDMKEWCVVIVADGDNYVRMDGCGGRCWWSNSGKNTPRRLFPRLHPHHFRCFEGLGLALILVLALY